MNQFDSSNLFKMPRDLSEHDVGRRGLEDALCFGEPSVNAALPVWLDGSSRPDCLTCGQSVPIFTDGQRIFTTASRCENLGSLPLTDILLNVPSGRLAVANDLRDLFPCDEPKLSINLPAGCHQMSLAYAEVGLAHGYVGNTCPSLWRSGDDLWIAGRREDENEDRAVEGVPEDARAIAYIITDLWWYSIADGDEYERRLRHFKQEHDPHSVQIVEVPPGLYLFRHDSDGRRTRGNFFDETRGSDLFATIRCVGPAAPRVDYLAAESKKHVTPGQYIAQSMRDWPTLFGSAESGENIARVVDHVFCAIGNGVDWHENGHPRIRLSPDIAGCVPAFAAVCAGFSQPHSWYPLSERYSAICVAAGLSDRKEIIHLSPEFARLAFNVLQCMIRRGIIPFNTGNTPAEVAAREREVREGMKLAARTYWALAEKYPEAATAFPEFAEWMASSRDNLDEYCDTFELPRSAR